MKTVLRKKMGRSGGHLEKEVTLRRKKSLRLLEG